jgi:diguanylate cyclase (GGDEF)-like protein/PAS domain S-box-containing protein
MESGPGVSREGDDGVLDPARRVPLESLRDLLGLAPDALLVVDAPGTIVLANAQVEALFGYSRDELIGQAVELLVPERLRARHRPDRERFTADPHQRGMGIGLDLYGRRRDGSEFLVEISLSPVRTDSGLLVCSAIRDITARRQAEKVAFHFAAVVESSHDAIVGMELDGTISSWNAAAAALYDYQPDQMIGRNISLLTPPGRPDELTDLLRRVRVGERVEDLETVHARRDGRRIQVSVTVSPIRDRTGAVIGVSTIARDIGERLRYQQQLEFLAEHDGLTGARNRRRFETDVTEQVRRSRRYGDTAALLLIDVDGMKQINDTHGHRAGDQALRAIAGTLTARLRDTDRVARIGGDEFAVLLPYASEEQAALVAGSLREGVAETEVTAEMAGCLDADAQLRLSISIGVVMIDRDTPDVEAIMVEADRAMYRDKRRSYDAS